MDEMVRWHHQLNVHEFEQTPRDRGQRKLVCCIPKGLQRAEHNLKAEQQPQRDEHVGLNISFHIVQR